MVGRGTKPETVQVFMAHPHHNWIGIRPELSGGSVTHFSPNANSVLVWKTLRASRPKNLKLGSNIQYFRVCLIPWAHSITSVVAHKNPNEWNRWILPLSPDIYCLMGNSCVSSVVVLAAPVVWRFRLVSVTRWRPALQDSTIQNSKWTNSSLQ